MKKHFPIIILLITGCSQVRPTEAVVRISPIIAGNWDDTDVLGLLWHSATWFREVGIDFDIGPVTVEPDAALAKPSDAYRLVLDHDAPGVQVWFVDSTWPDPEICTHCIIGRGSPKPKPYALIPRGGNARLIAHEIGHALGLPHRDNDPAWLEPKPIMAATPGLLGGFDQDEGAKMRAAIRN